MQHILLTFVIVCGMIGMIEAGVKIEISRVKDPPTTSTPSQNKDANEIETTETTTIVPPPTTQPSMIKPVNDSHIMKLTNATLNTTNTTNSTIEVTTIAPLNANGTVNPAQANITNNKDTSLVYKNMTLVVSAKDLNPYLSEFTRRQMRRRLIPADYYCPCDLRVNLILKIVSLMPTKTRHTFNSIRFLFKFSFFSMKIDQFL